MNQGFTHTERHLHTHELSICACEAALLALKTRGERFGQERSSKPVAEGGPWSPGAGFSALSIPSSPDSVARRARNSFVLELSCFCWSQCWEQPTYHQHPLSQDHPEPRGTQQPALTIHPGCSSKSLQEHWPRHPSRTLDKQDPG